MTDLTTDLLTLRGFGQRQVSYHFDILDRELSVIGRLEVSDDGVQVENNINRTIKRQMNGVTFPPNVINDVNPFSDRIRPMMTLQDGTLWPLGVFMFSEQSTVPMTGTVGFTHNTFLDQALILDQPVNRAYGFKPGTLIRDAISKLLAASPITQFEIDESTSVIRGKEWATWPPGTHLLQIIYDLCALGSYYSLFFDNAGVAQVITVPDLAAEPATIRYGTVEGEQRIFQGTVVETNDLLQAPNRYIVVNSSLTDETVIGFWDVPASAPHSIDQRGFVVARVIDLQTVDTNAEATKAAKAKGQADFSTFSWVTFDAAPDPRHDTFDIISYNTVNYREQTWTLTMSPEGPHRHELRRIFGEDTPPAVSELGGLP